MTDIVTPPTIAPLPAPPQPSDTPAEFDAKAFASLAAQVAMTQQTNASAAATQQNATAAHERAVAANASATTATQQADAAMGYRNTANNAASLASTKRDEAVAAAALASTKRDEAVAAAAIAGPAAADAISARDAAQAAAATAGAPLVATSSTSLTIGIATQNLNVGTGKGFAPGQTVTIARVAAPSTAWMRGTVLAYTSSGAGPLSVAVAEVSGSGTHTDWSVSVAGNRGASSLTLPVTHITTNTAGASNVFYVLDAALVLTMPASPTDGDFFAFSNRSGGVPTINPAGKKIKGDATVLSLDTPNATACLKYDAATGDWLEAFAGFTVATISTQANIAADIHAAPAKSTPADADELGYVDSAAGWGLVKLTWANLKAWLSALFVSKSGDTVAGNLSVAGSLLATVGPLGYGPGAGGTVTQSGSNTTNVTLNKPCGQITMAAPMAAGASAVFSVTNSHVTLRTVILLTLGQGMVGAYSVEADANSGYFRLYVRNVLGSATSAPAVINFAVIAGSAT